MSRILFDDQWQWIIQDRNTYEQSNHQPRELKNSVGGVEPNGGPKNNRPIPTKLNCMEFEGNFSWISQHSQSESRRDFLDRSSVSQFIPSWVQQLTVFSLF